MISRQYNEQMGNYLAKLAEKSKPTTNADRIRSMTDEELAKLMVASCAKHMTIETCRLHEKCYECWLEWLKQDSETIVKGAE